MLPLTVTSPYEKSRVGRQSGRRRIYVSTTRRHNENM